MMCMAQLHAESVYQKITDKKGREIEAQIIEFKDGVVTLKRKSDEKAFSLPENMLSDESRKLIIEAMKITKLPVIAAEPNKKIVSKENEKIANIEPVVADAIPLHESGLPLSWFQGLPSKEAYLTQVESFAARLEVDAAKKEYVKRLKNLIAKIRQGEAGAYSELAKRIMIGNSFHKIQNDCPKGFDALLQAFANQDKDAHATLFQCYNSWWGSIPLQYSLDCFRVTQSHADKGDPYAMIAMAIICTNNWKLGRENIAKIEGSGSPKLTPENAQIWIDKALNCKLDESKKSELKQMKANFYMISHQAEKAVSIARSYAEEGDSIMMLYLASCLHLGNGCEKDLKASLEWYEKAEAKNPHKGPDPASGLKEELYGIQMYKQSIAITYKDYNFDAKIYGNKESKKYAVIFGSSGFHVDEFVKKLKWFENLFNDGWSIVVFNYPQAGEFNRVGMAISSWSAKEDLGMPPLNFSGFGKTVFDAINKFDPSGDFCFIGNSLGAGAMAWDLQEIQKEKKIRVIWVSPTETFLPSVDKLQAIGDVSIIASNGIDKFVRKDDLSKWIKEHAVNQQYKKLGELPEGHLILGENMKWEKLVTLILKENQ